MGRRGKASHLADLERRISEQQKQIADLQARVDTCENDRQGLHEENYRLLRRVMKLENGGS